MIALPRSRLYDRQQARLQRQSDHQPITIVRSLAETLTAVEHQLCTGNAVRSPETWQFTSGIAAAVAAIRVL
ncbi:MAG: hypothetical protein HC838_01020 [Spirulinaceae cyanobacterium RM2_2_10]|nr:hypothetical protein [Spirulinaceae cyanobacterium RM2_2_10]